MDTSSPPRALHPSLKSKKNTPADFLASLARKYYTCDLHLITYVCKAPILVVPPWTGKIIINTFAKADFWFIYTSATVPKKKISMPALCQSAVFGNHEWEFKIGSAHSSHCSHPWHPYVVWTIWSFLWKAPLCVFLQNGVLYLLLLGSASCSTLRCH